MTEFCNLDLIAQNHTSPQKIFTNEKWRNVQGGVGGGGREMYRGRNVQFSERHRGAFIDVVIT